MDNKQELNKIADKIRKACSGYYAQVWVDRGLFIIHDVKQRDYNFILVNLNNIKEVRNISHTSRYDFTKPFFGVAPEVYTIRGNFSLSAGSKSLQV